MLKGESANLPNWLVEDNSERSGKYARDLSNEKFQIDLNEILEKHESTLEKPKDEAHPILYFWGVPRCGKTVFSQLLSSSFNIGYPDNIVARFWLAPSYGIRLSKILLGEQSASNFESDYGKTSSLSDPHDFAYFWRHWLKIGNLKEYDHLAERSGIDWDGLGEQLRQMSTTWDKPVVFKGVLPSYHVKNFHGAYNKSLFILIERDFIDSAVSLMKGRNDNYNNPDHWYGQTPAIQHTKMLLGKPGAEQIAGQFKYLHELYDEELGSINEKQVLRIKYKEFCEDPKAIVDMISGRSEELWGQPIEIKHTPSPEVFKFSAHAESAPYYSELAAALEKEGLPLRHT